MSMKYNKLVVATVTQCQIFTAESWSTPVQFDIPRDSTINLICQSEKYLLLVDHHDGIQVKTGLPKRKERKREREREKKKSIND